MPDLDQSDQEIEPKINPQALISYLVSPPRYFSSRRSGEWQILNKAGVLCTVVFPWSRNLFRKQARQALKNAEISPDEEIERLVENWYRAGLLSK